MENSAQQGPSRGRGRPRRGRGRVTDNNPDPGIVNDPPAPVVNEVAEALRNQSAAFQAMAGAFTEIANRWNNAPPPGNDGDLEDVSSNEEEDVGADPLNDLLSLNAPSINSNDADEDIVAAALATIQEPSTFGPAFEESIAEKFNQLPGIPLSKREEERLSETYKVPVNMKLVSVPKVNPEVWAKLQKEERSSDVNLQSLQTHLSRGLVAVAHQVGEIRQKPVANDAEKKFMGTLLSNALDIGRLLGSAHREISIKRKIAMRRSIGSPFDSLCSTKGPITDFLFGDNLDQQIKAARTADQLGKSSLARRPDYQNVPKNKFNRGQKRKSMDSGNFSGGQPKRRQGPPAMQRRRNDKRFH